MGVSIYDVRKIFGILDPLPPCLHMGLIYIHATSLTMYIFWATPPVQTSYMDAPYDVHRVLGFFYPLPFSLSTKSILLVCKFAAFLDTLPS